MPGKRFGGRQRKRWSYVVKENMTRPSFSKDKQQKEMNGEWGLEPSSLQQWEEGLDDDDGNNNKNNKNNKNNNKSTFQFTTFMLTIII